MEHFIVSARKYRPQNFEDVVGQQAITNTLENAIKNNHLAQALLFTGPRGVGKTSCARILAKRINQEASENKTDEDFAFNIFELDAASNNSVDDIRNLTEQVRIPPQSGNYKVYIIDEVHMLSTSAFNAFLKTLEEPPKHAIFILATTEKHKIIPTILSRCQIFDFKRISVLDAKNYLKKIAENQGITADDEALHIIAQKADGAMRDALSIFDRVVSFCGTNLTREAVSENLNILDYDTYFNITDLLLENKIPEILNAYNSILSRGFEGRHFINGLASHFRDLLVAKDMETIPLLEVGDATKKKYLEQSQKATMPFLMQAIDKANDCDLKYRASKNQRLLVELTLMQIGSITFDGAKKKSTNFIIPSTFFTTLVPPKKNIIKPKLKQEKIEFSNQDVPNINDVERKVSAFSLKNVHLKREHIKQETEQIDVDKLPKDKFSIEKLNLSIKKHINQLIQSGNNNIASIIDTAKVNLNGTDIQLTLGSNLNREQVTPHIPELLHTLRKALNNYIISIKLNVDETIVEKFIYTNQEKYDRMLEKNKNLELLRKTFGLDV